MQRRRCTNKTKLLSPTTIPIAIADHEIADVHNEVDALVDDIFGGFDPSKFEDALKGHLKF